MVVCIIITTNTCICTSLVPTSCWLVLWCHILNSCICGTKIGIVWRCNHLCLIYCTIAWWIRWWWLWLSHVRTNIAWRILTTLNLSLVRCRIECVVSLVLNILTWYVLCCIRKIIISYIWNSSIDSTSLILNTCLILSSINSTIIGCCSI